MSIDLKKENNRKWIIAENDLETIETARLLEKNGEDVIEVEDCNGNWNCGEVKEFLDKNVGRYDEVNDIRFEKTKSYSLRPGGSPMNPKDYVEKKSDEPVTYKKRVWVPGKGKDMDYIGINIIGEVPNYPDHSHIYNINKNTSSDTIMEQVAKMLNIDLDLDQKFIVANSKGYIPEMERLGRNLNLSEEEIQEKINDTLYKERAIQEAANSAKIYDIIFPKSKYSFDYGDKSYYHDKANQFINEEKQAQEIVDKLGEIKEKQKLILVDLPDMSIRKITDRLYGKCDNLLITCRKPCYRNHMVIGYNYKTFFSGENDIYDILKSSFREDNMSENMRNISEKINSECLKKFDKNKKTWESNKIYGSAEEQNAIRNAVYEGVISKNGDCKDLIKDSRKTKSKITFSKIKQAAGKILKKKSNKER